MSPIDEFIIDGISVYLYTSPQKALLLERTIHLNMSSAHFDCNCYNLACDDCPFSRLDNVCMSYTTIDILSAIAPQIVDKYPELLV